MRCDFSIGRQVASAEDIPPLHPHATIPLLFTSQMRAKDLEQIGARKGKVGWFVKAAEDLDIDRIEHLLPRFAHRVVYPEVPDLIPSSSWHSSLCNLLAPVSWKAVSAPVLQYWEGCEECGRKSPLECHELWDYQEAESVQRLVNLRSLCRDCHKMQHLGLAEHRGDLDAVLWRHAMINRLFEHEMSDLFAQAMEKWEKRSARPWTLHLPGDFLSFLRLKNGVEQIGPTTLRTNVGGRSIITEIAGMAIDAYSEGLCLVGK